MTTGTKLEGAVKKTVNWDEIRRRLESTRTFLEQEHAIAPHEARRILRERAQDLAREDEKTVTEESLEVLEFHLAHESYGIESAHVREVYPLKDYTSLPGTPPFVLGIINVRGRIVSVLDLKKFFDLPQKGITESNKVIILSNGAMEFGILADAVSGTLTVSPDGLQTTLPTLKGVRAEYLKGVTPERMVVLDGSRLLADPKLVIAGAADR